MKLKSIVITVAVLAVLAAFAAWINRPEHPAESDPRVGRPVADAAAIEKAQRLRLSDQGKTLTLTREADGSWRDDDYFGFPADFSKLTGFVGDLAGATVQRLVTTNPSRLARLEFKDTKIEFLDSSGHPLWSLTLGKVGEPAGRFVRFDDEPRAYFANLNVWMDLDAKGWAAPNLLDLKADDLSRIEIGFGRGDPLVVSRARKGDPWRPDKTPAGQRLKDEKVSSLVSSLGTLRFTETSDPGDSRVAAAREHLRTFRFATFDGRTYTVAVGRKPEEKRLKPPAPAAAKPAEGKSKAPADAAKGTPAPAPKAPEPEYETIPAGPVFVWVASSEAKAPVNALMRKRAFQIDDYVFTGLPETPADFFEAAPPPPPAPKRG